MTTPGLPQPGQPSLEQQQYVAGQNMQQAQLAQQQAQIQSQIDPSNPQNAQRQLAAAAKFVQTQAAYNTSQSAGNSGISSLIPDWIKTPAEWVGAKAYWVYSNVISRPITTAMLTADVASSKNEGLISNGGLFDSGVWSQAYRDAGHVSPGQVLYQDFLAPTGTGGQLTPVVQGQKGKTVDSLLWDHPDQVHQEFSHGAAQWISGTTDAAVSWYADPMAIGGKAIKDLKVASYIRPAETIEKPTAITAARNAFSNVLDNKGFGRTADFIKSGDTVKSNVANLVSSGAFTKFGDYIWEQKNLLSGTADNAEEAEAATAANAAKGPEYVEPPAKPAAQAAAANGEIPSAAAGQTAEGVDTTLKGNTFGAWVARQPWTQKGAGADALARLLGQATTRDDVDQILRVGVGDQAATRSLDIKNAALRAQANDIIAKQDQLYTSMPNPGNFNPVRAISAKNQLQRLAAQLDDINNQSQKINDTLEVAGHLRNGIYFNPYTTPLLNRLGEAARTVQNRKVFGQGLGALGMAGTVAHNLFYSTPVRIFGGDALTAVRPNGYIQLHDPNSFRELDAEMAASKVFTQQERDQYVTRYLNTPTELKSGVLKGIESDMLGRQAANYGMNPDQAKALYSSFDNLRGAIKDGQSYGSGVSFTGPNGEQIPIDRYEGHEAVGAHPVLLSQLANTHIFMDSGKMNQILKYNSRAFKALLGDGHDLGEAADLATTIRNTTDTSKTGVNIGYAINRTINGYEAVRNVMNTLWKFNTLLRFGYGPRAISDDLLSQVAKFGAWSVTSRAATGLAGQALRRSAALPWYDDSLYQATKISSEGAIAGKQMEIEQHQADLQNIQRSIAKTPADVKTRAFNAQLKQSQIEYAQEQMDALKNAHARLLSNRAKIGDRPIMLSNGQVVDAPFEGTEGQMFKDLNAGRKTYDNAMGVTANGLLTHMRAQDWTLYSHGDKNHLSAWAQAVTRQLANDPAAVHAMNGKAPDWIANWMRKTPEGKQYYRSLGLSNITQEEQADRVSAITDHLLPSYNAEYAKIREAAAAGKNMDDATVIKQMKAAIATGVRPPDVSGAQVDWHTGVNGSLALADKAMSGYYKIMNELPVETLSRNPLFSQIYHNHIMGITKTAEDQGITHFSGTELQRMAKSARQMALQDVKRYTYNMDFETKLTHAMRTVAPFFGPTQEAYRRWGRIIADDPSIIAHAATMYTAPYRSGHAVDQNGQPIVDGYSTDPATGKKVLVPMQEQYLQFQAPKSIANALGIGQFGAPEIQMPLTTFQTVLRGNTWYDPGFGPWVQVAANHLAKTADPRIGDVMTSLGILPYGISQSDMSILQGGLTKYVNNQQVNDTSQQQMMLNLVQDYNYQVTNGLIKQMPSWAAIQKQAQSWANLQGWMKGTNFMPYSSNFKDPYQAFRDAYKIMEAQDPMNADQNFYNKFGASAYAFTQNLVKNNQSGVPATAQAVLADQKYSDFTSQFPQLAAIVAGTYSGTQGFSETAYKQQEFSGQRTQMTAQEAWNQAQVNLGWQQYSEVMNGLKAQLFQRGLTSFTQSGAKDLNATKKAFTSLMSSVYQPDGVTANPYYNPQWTAAYNTNDPSKDDAQAEALTRLINTPGLIPTNSKNPAPGETNRMDLQGLAQYLVLRQATKQMLAQSTSQNISAKANAGIKNWFTQQLFALMESNTQFEDLHDRYLSKDMFDHYESTADQTLAQTQADGGTVSGQ
jgi:hypothetical protein